MKQIAPLFLLLCLLSACRERAPNARLAFYHWKQHLDTQPAEQRLLDSLSAERVYLRVFDLDWNERMRSPAPVSEMSASRWPKGIREWVPTIFITNRSLKQLPIQETPELARKIVRKVRQVTEGSPMAGWEELQLDCDWTEGTREVYFRLLQECEKLLGPEGKTLSATVRLHQYRYPERTGVPPVSRGMLMYYNMGELQQWAEPNSILNLQAAAPYLEADDYPLPLDLALPLFRWGVLFRSGEMIRLINGLSGDDLQDRSRFFPMADNRYEVVKGTFLQGHYLYSGDQLRLEAVSPDSLMAAAQQLQAVERRGDFYLSFYHLDSTVAAGYKAAFLQQLVQTLEQEDR